MEKDTSSYSAVETRDWTGNVLLVQSSSSQNVDLIKDYFLLVLLNKKHFHSCLNSCRFYSVEGDTNDNNNYGHIHQRQLEDVVTSVTFTAPIGSSCWSLLSVFF